MLQFIQIDDLCIDFTLAETAYSTVRRAYFEGNPVAIKTMRESSPVSIADELARKLANDLNGIEDPSLPFYRGVIENPTGLVMGYVAGTELRQTLELGPLNRAWVSSIARHVMSALRALHGRGVLHRAITLSNVRVTEEKVVLVDLGFFEPSSSYAEVPLRSLPPEQREAGLPSSVQTDLYALGVVLHEAALGRDFRGTCLMEELEPKLGTGLSEVIARLLAPRPEARHSSAIEALDHLCRVEDRSLVVPVQGIRRDEVPPPAWIRPVPSDDSLMADLTSRFDAVCQPFLRIRLARESADATGLWLEDAVSVLTSLQLDSSGSSAILPQAGSLNSLKQRIAELKPELDEAFVSKESARLASFVVSEWIVAIRSRLQDQPRCELGHNLFPSFMTDDERDIYQATVQQLAFSEAEFNALMADFGLHLLEAPEPVSIPGQVVIKGDAAHRLFAERRNLVQPW